MTWHQFPFFLKTGKIKNVDKFVFGLVTPTGTSGTQYFIVIDDISAFNNFASKFVNGNTINHDYVSTIDSKYFMNGILTGTDPAKISDNEIAFLDLIQDLDSGLKVLKGDATFSNWQSMKKGENDQLLLFNCN